ncbi:hypothetical protein BN844_2860 [Pseudomonas sp. SHC52]|nr:hypothetical protein BN844_2860 [Pseudomonas sp. SHC52]
MSASRGDGTGTIACRPRVVMRLVPGYRSAVCVCLSRPMSLFQSPGSVSL